MALIRALNAAISGLKSYQYSIDTTGNNLANLATTAFKTGRANFETLFSQTLSFGNGPQGNLGGIDPQQLGLGVQVGDTTRDFSQGGLKSTGVQSDLAIEGDGFFLLKDINGAPVFTRDGTFSINPLSQLHDPVTGRIVQGYAANLNTFQITPGGPLSDIQIPIGKLTIAKATTEMNLAGNLDGGGTVADSGTVLTTTQFLDSSNNPATLSTPLAGLKRMGPSGPVDLNLATNNVISLNALKGSRQIQTTFQISANPPTGSVDGTGTTLGDLVNFLRRRLGINNSTQGAYSAERTTGAIQAGDTINATSYTAGSAVNFDTLGVETGDFIRVTSGPAAGQLARITSLASANGGINNVLNFDSNFTFDPTIPLPTSGDQYAIQEQARVSLGTGGAAAANPSLQDTKTTAGVIRIAGNVGTANAITDISLAKQGGDEMATFTQSAAASGESLAINSTAYDSLGNAHLVTLTYALLSKSSLDLQRGNRFLFLAETDSNASKDLVAGNGFVQFDTSGKFQAINPVNPVAVDLSNSGATTPLSLSLDMSQMTDFSDGSSDVSVVNQDGLAKGTLNDYSIGNDGIVTGIFSNGVTRSLAQIALARFDNPNGLLEAGHNTFTVGPNSGLANIGTPGSFARGTIRSGTLEESNVDMAKEFTNLIVSQRAFQANARTISVSDQMLQDLISIT